MNKKIVNAIKNKKTIYCCILFIMLYLVILFINNNNNINKAYEEAQRNSIDGAQTLVFTDGIYSGNVVERNLIGEGKYMLDTGDYYTGQWNDNLPNGDGKLIVFGVGKYIGQFDDGKRNGEGTFYFNDGKIIEGRWENDVIVGDVKITYSDSSYFEGTLNENNEIYSGYYLIPLDNGVCEYAIKEGIISEEVSVFFDDGTSITGKIENGKFNGECEVKYSNGDYYRGNIVDNMKSGKGLYHWEKDTGFDPEFEGEWKDDMMNGDGIYFYNGKPFFYNEGNVLKGNFVNNKANGECLFTIDGAKWTTIWNNGICVSIKKAE